MLTYSVSDVLPFNEEVGTINQQPPSAQIEGNRIVANDGIAFQIVKILAVVLFASAHSLSVPIFIIVMENEFSTHENRSLEQKILAPLLPYMFLVACNSWLIWNNIGHRMNGRIDSEIQMPDNTFTQAPYHILTGLMANLSSFTNAFLTVYAGLSSTPVLLKMTAAISLGGLNYTTDIYTDVVAAFRKHVENKQAQNQKIAPFFKQKYAQPLEKYALVFGTILRELLPIVRGTLWAKITTSGVASTFSSVIGNHAVATINLPLGIMIYWSVAYSTRFDLIQFRDNMQAAGKPFEIENTASRSLIMPIRLAGKISNGQILVDTLKKLKLSTVTSVNITLAFFALSVMTILQQALHAYVSNAYSNPGSNDVLLVNYCFGNKKAEQLAPKFEIAIMSVAVTLGIIGTFAKSANLHKYASDKENRIETVVHPG